MAPTALIPCKFFAYGSCKYGNFCNFFHDEDKRGGHRHFDSVTGVSNIIERLDASSLTTVPGLHLNKQGEGFGPAPWDSRAKIACKFMSRPGGCQKDACPFLHDKDSKVVEESSNLAFKPDEVEDQVHDDDFTRVLLGASVDFNEFGRILKASFPTDYSLACITGLESGSSPETVVNILRGLGFNLTVDCVRVSKHTALSETQATIKVEDPLFAEELGARLKSHGSSLSAIPVAIDARRTNCRKVYTSWHKPTRSVWLNFESGTAANRVARKFNEGRYKCLGQLVKSSMGGRPQRPGVPYSQVATTIILSDVPGDATSTDVKRAIVPPQDRPGHVEMGSVSYQASHAEVSVKVRSRLEEYGELESFYLAPAGTGKRAKATAWFRDESDARLACSLNNTPLDILEKGKLTVTLIQSAKVKVYTRVYAALKGRIDEETTAWKDKHLEFRVYTDSLQRFITLKIEGNNVKDVASARQKLDEILSGIVLMDGEKAIWSSALSSNGRAYENLKSIEKRLNVVISRDKSKRQVRFYGTDKKLQQAVLQITDMLREETSKGFEIDLEPNQFSWTIHGGFKNIEQALGSKVAVFNVVSKRITINGTREQYEIALAIMDGKHVPKDNSLPHRRSAPEGDCPICFCEADNPIQTSCNHIYCLECFEECCKSAASTSKDDFQIRCQGDEGTCSTVFTLSELKDHLSSFVFEMVLELAFKDYIQRHPETFHYCPTADCGYIYRCTAAGSKPRAYMCPNCLEPLCTSCHAHHGNYTCAEYKDITSGGYEALKKLKRELNIKDCPKCTTPIEKTEGCNHMTCGGCRAHICWVCMSVFEASGPCYDHMTKMHGGIGLEIELQRFLD